MPEIKHDRVPARIWKALAGVVVLLFLVGFFSGNGKPEERKVVEQKTTDQARALAPAPSLESIREIVRIPLLGEDMLSEVPLRSGAIPPYWYYYFEGPSSAKIHFDDGTVSSITEWYGLKNGSGRFSGPAGKEVVVKAYPPR